MTLICLFMLESKVHLLLKTDEKDSLQKAPPRQEVAQTLKAKTETLLSVPHVAPVIVPDISSPEDRWKDICFLSECLTLSAGLLLTLASFFNHFCFRRGEEKGQIPLSSNYYTSSMAHVEMVDGTTKTKVSGLDYIVSWPGDISRLCFLSRQVKPHFLGATRLLDGNLTAVFVLSTLLYVGKGHGRITCKWTGS